VRAPKVVAAVLRGKHSCLDTEIKWEGQWGSNAEAHSTPGQTSTFSYTCTDGAGRGTTAALEGTTIAVSGSYSGYFMMAQAPPAPPLKVAEKDLRLTFTPDGSTTKLTVFGKGTNDYGPYELDGTYDMASGVIDVTKGYVQKKMKIAKVPKVPKAAGVATPSMPRQSSRPPKPKTPGSAHLESGDLVPHSGGLTADETMMANLTPRNRSERKRKTPIHLKEDDNNGSVVSSQHMQRCEAILKEVANGQFAGPFMQPVQYDKLGIPDYPNIVKHPMDLGTVQVNLQNGKYHTPDEYAADVRLTFKNAMIYNNAQHAVHKWAKALTQQFERKYSQMMQTLGAPAKFVQKSDDGFSGKTPKTGKGAKGGKGPRGATPKTGGKTPGGTMKYPRKNKPADGDQTPQLRALEEQLAAMHKKLEVIMQQGAGGGSGGGGGGGGAAPRRGQEVDDSKRPMTFDEKRELSININKLPGDKLTRVLEIISESMPVSQQHDPDQEIEIDIAKLDTSTLRQLQRYVKVGPLVPCVYSPFRRTDIALPLFCRTV
jgi:hypothetical protein